MRTVVAVLLVLLAGCARHQQRAVTSWLRIDIVRPPGGTSGMIVLGPNHEEFQVRVGKGWKRLGVGHPCSYMVLGGGEAALVDINDRKGAQFIAEGDEELRPMANAFGETAPFLVVSPPSVCSWLRARGASSCTQSVRTATGATAPPIRAWASPCGRSSGSRSSNGLRRKTWSAPEDRGNGLVCVSTRGISYAVTVSLP